MLIVIFILNIWIKFLNEYISVLSWYESICHHLIILAIGGILNDCRFQWYIIILNAWFISFIIQCFKFIVFNDREIYCNIQCFLIANDILFQVFLDLVLVRLILLKYFRFETTFLFFFLTEIFLYIGWFSSEKWSLLCW